MAKKLFIGNLPFQVSDMDLKELFQEYGEVSSAKVVVDRRTGRSRGFGFIEMSSDESAEHAIEGLNGAEVKGRPINVGLAREQSEQKGSNSGSGEFGRRNSYNDY